jgi:hypothetical protein
MGEGKGRPSLAGRRRMMRMTLGLALVFALWGGAAAPEKAEDLAEKNASAWLALVDEGKYGESWETASSLFKGKVTKEQWQQAAASARGPLGKLVSRKLKDAKAADSLPGAPDGKYVVLQYDTVFERKKEAVETVTPMRDPDGVFRVAGYFVR